MAFHSTGSASVGKVVAEIKTHYGVSVFKFDKLRKATWNWHELLVRDKILTRHRVREILLVFVCISTLGSKYKT